MFGITLLQGLQEILASCHRIYDDFQSVKSPLQEWHENRCFYLKYFFFGIIKSFAYICNTITKALVWCFMENISVCYYSISMLKLRNFQDNTIRIRWQMPAYSVGASYTFVLSGILRPQHRKDKKMTSTLFLCLGLRIQFSLLLSMF